MKDFITKHVKSLKYIKKAQHEIVNMNLPHAAQMVMIERDYQVNYK